MTEDLEKYYELRFDMMSHQGWKDLIEEVESSANETNKLSSVSSTYSLDFRRGQLEVLNWLLSLETVSKQTYEDLQNEKTL